MIFFFLNFYENQIETEINNKELQNINHLILNKIQRIHAR